MENFKKIQLIAISLLALVALFIGIKNIISPALDFTDLKVATSALLFYLFNFGLNINLILRNRCRTIYVWLPACIFSTVALVMWLMVVWFDFGNNLNSLLKASSAASLLALTFTNMTCVTLARNSSIFTPFFAVTTQITCILFSLAGLYFIIFANDLEILIRTILVLFLLLCYCNCMLAFIQIHERKLLQRKFELTLTKTATAGIYADKLGNLYNVSEAITDTSKKQEPNVTQSDLNTNVSAEAK